MVEMGHYLAPWDIDENAAPWNAQEPVIDDTGWSDSPVPVNTEQSMTIPKFGKNDFYTSRPYEWLQQFDGDAFKQQTMLLKLKEYAGTVGIRSFVALYTNWQKSHLQSGGVGTEQTTQFDQQPIELVSGEYLCTDAGVARNDKFGFPVQICRHPILPIRRLVNIDTGEERLEIAYRKGVVWRTIVVEKSIIASSNQILQLAAYGVMVNSENAKLLSTYLMDMEQLNYDTIPEQRSVGRMGWVIPGVFSPYLDGIAFDGEQNYQTLFGAVNQEGDRQVWIDTMKAVRAEKTLARVFLAASFASVLVEPCGLLPFFVHAWGGSGSGKTVSLMIASSVWASPRNGDYIMTFNSTDVGQEMVAGFLNSLPLCMDELQIQASQGVKEFDRIIYKLTEGQGKTRGSKTGGIKQTLRWRNCVLTTGEFPIISGHSMGGAVQRVIEFECTEKVYSDLIGLCGIIEQNYGWAGLEFIRWLQQDGNIQRVRDEQKRLFSALQKQSGLDKQAGSLSAILTADKIVTELFFQDGNGLTVEDMADLMVEANKADPNVRAAEYLMEWVSTNPIHFKPDDNGDYRQEVWGKEDYDKVYVVRHILERELSNAGFNSTAFISWANRKRLLDTDTKGGKLTKVARIGGSLVRCICIDRTALTTLLDGAVTTTADEQEISDLPF